MQHVPNVHLIFWGSNWNTTGAVLRQQLLTLFQGLEGSAYQKILGQYYDSTGHVTSFVTVTSYTDASVVAPSGVNASKIDSEINSAIALNHWSSNGESQFTVLTAPGTTYEQSFTSGFCAYHSLTSGGAPYAFDPYAGDPPFSTQCAGYDAAQNPNNITSMLASHEYAETATDPYINEWLTSDGYEVGDICASKDDVLESGSVVQGQWDNALNACSLGDASAPIVHVTGGGIASASGEAGTLDLIFESTNGMVRDLSKVSEKWTLGDLDNILPTPTGPFAVGRPAVFRSVGGVLSVVFRDSAGRVWLSTKGSGSWAETQIAASAAGDPVPLTMASGEVNIFFRNTSGHLIDAMPSGGWHSVEMGVSLEGNCLALVQVSGVRSLFCRGVGSIVELYYESGWHTTTIVEGVQVGGGDPVPVQLASGEINIFYNSQQSLIEVKRDMGRWHGINMATAIEGSPSALVMANGTRTFFMRDPSGQIDEWYYEGGWRKATLGEGAHASSDPVGYQQPNGTLNVFYVGEGEVVEMFVAMNRWNGRPIGGWGSG